MNYRVGTINSASPLTECDGMDAAISCALQLSRLVGSTVIYVEDGKDKVRLVYRGEVFVKESQCG